jgi:hypothetical protein
MMDDCRRVDVRDPSLYPLDAPWSTGHYRLGCLPFSPWAQVTLKHEPLGSLLGPARDLATPLGTGADGARIPRRRPPRNGSAAATASPRTCSGTLPPAGFGCRPDENNAAGRPVGQRDGGLRAVFWPAARPKVLSVLAPQLGAAGRSRCRSGGSGRRAVRLRSRAGGSSVSAISGMRNRECPQQATFREGWMSGSMRQAALAGPQRSVGESAGA